MSHTTSFRGRTIKLPFSQISEGEHQLLHLVAHDLNPTLSGTWLQRPLEPCLASHTTFPFNYMTLITLMVFNAPIMAIIPKGTQPLGDPESHHRRDTSQLTQHILRFQETLRSEWNWYDLSFELLGCRGQHQFFLQHCWFMQMEWLEIRLILHLNYSLLFISFFIHTPFGEIQIIQEEFPLRTPRDELGPLNASIAKLVGDVGKNGDVGLTDNLMIGKQSWKGEIRINFSGTFWPFWVYSMYYSYCLAQRAAIVGTPSMDGLLKKPNLLSFCIASKIYVSEFTRQELLEIDGISYRLPKEIELLESLDLIQYINYKTTIARQSDMLAMSSDGPLSAYVKPHNFVHDIMTFYKANGLAVIGPAVRESSWFPGYAWTITNYATFETHMGSLFTITNKSLNLRMFWGIQSS
ncbi:hypothetical protein UlMin_004478 [Ulmus minor]